MRMCALILALISHVDSVSAQTGTLDPRRADATFPSDSALTGYATVLNLSDDERVIYDAIVQASRRDVAWCDALYISAAHWVSRWEEELPALAGSPVGRGRMLVDVFLMNDEFWAGRARIEEDMFASILAVVPDRAERVRMLSESRSRARARRVGGGGSVDLVTALAETEPEAFSHAEVVDVMQSYSLRANAILESHRVFYEQTFVPMRDRWQKGAANREEIRQTYLRLAEHGAQERALQVRTLATLQALGVVSTETVSQLNSRLYPPSLDSHHITMVQLRDSLPRILDVELRRRVQRVIQGLEESQTNRWKELRVLYDAAYSRASIESWADGMAAHLVEGGPFPSPRPDYERMLREVPALPVQLTEELRSIRESLAAGDGSATSLRSAIAEPLVVEEDLSLLASASRRTPEERELIRESIRAYLIELNALGAQIPSRGQSTEDGTWSAIFTSRRTLERQLMSSLKSTRDVTWNSSVDHLLRVRAIRRMVRSADALVGVRYRDIGEVIDFLRPLGGLGVDQSTVDNYLSEMTLLVERFDLTVPKYADLMASADDRQANRLRSAIIDLVNTIGAIDGVNHRLVSELGEHGHTELREAINRAAFAPVHAPPPVASLVSELKAIDLQLSPEERAAVEAVWADFLEQETTIKSRIVASLGQWESVEATLRRVADAERNGRIREWRSWGILDHPSIPLWREHTQLAGRAWLEVSRIFSDERCAELPIHVGVALRLLDRGKMQ